MKRRKVFNTTAIAIAIIATLKKIVGWVIACLRVGVRSETQHHGSVGLPFFCRRRYANGKPPSGHLRSLTQPTQKLSFRLNPSVLIHRRIAA
ncbi:MAG: hypothetical protein V7L25_34725 [Nostoc sp.]|uniref:hypothetical protein n=1 Tax=Nostoc sp. TaxID=1180 RepID=UPI002FF2263B